MSKTRFSTMPEAEELVQNKIANKKVMVFAKKFCPYCSQVIDLFDKYVDKGILSSEDFEMMDIGRHQMVQDYLGILTGARTVPRVFIKGKCIGGANETVALFRGGNPKKILEEI